MDFYELNKKMNDSEYQYNEADRDPMYYNPGDRDDMQKWVNKLFQTGRAPDLNDPNLDLEQLYSDLRYLLSATHRRDEEFLQELQKCYKFYLPLSKF